MGNEGRGEGRREERRGREEEGGEDKSAETIKQVHTLLYLTRCDLVLYCTLCHSANVLYIHEACYCIKQLVLYPSNVCAY